MKATESFNSEFAKALITFFPAESAYYCSLYEADSICIYPIDKLSDVIKEYCNSTGQISEDDIIKIFNLGLASSCRKLCGESRCFFIRDGRIIISDYESIFADSLDEMGNGFMIAELIDWLVDRIYYESDGDTNRFFELFKGEVAKMPGSKDILSKMSVDDVINMSKIARRMLGRD